VTEGRINRLLINVPPGSSKSLIVSVMWPAWEWGPMRPALAALPGHRVQRGPGEARHAQVPRPDRPTGTSALWPDVKLTRTAETSFANSSTGTREGVPFGSLTSQRGDRLIIDDPHSTETAESDTERLNTTRKFREGAVNRLNDQEKSAIVVIMQRLHEQDISGVIISLGMDYVHLMLPMEFDPQRACETPIGFKDPRTDDGELLDPKRFPREWSRSSSATWAAMPIRASTSNRRRHARRHVPARRLRDRRRRAGRRRRGRAWDFAASSRSPASSRTGPWACAC
jgi:hypothetical protein